MLKDAITKKTMESNCSTKPKLLLDKCVMHQYGREVSMVLSNALLAEVRTVELYIYDSRTKHFLGSMQTDQFSTNLVFKAKFCNGIEYTMETLIQTKF